MTEASGQFGKTIGTARLSNDERLACGMAGMLFAKKVEMLGLSLNPFE